MRLKRCSIDFLFSSRIFFVREKVFLCRNQPLHKCDITNFLNGLRMKKKNTLRNFKKKKTYKTLKRLLLLFEFLTN